MEGKTFLLMYSGHKVCSGIDTYRGQTYILFDDGKSFAPIDDCFFLE